MVNWNKKFKVEYDLARVEIAKNIAFERGWQPLVRRLESLMSVSGYDAAHENALTDLRTQVLQGPRQTKVTEDKGILEAVGAWADADGPTIAADAKKRAACLKLLRHTYLQNKAGNRKVWICSLPTTFTDWPSSHLANNAATGGAMKQALASNIEQFTDQQRRYLGAATFQAIAWCQKAGIVLGAATLPGAEREKVKLWFAEAGLADATLNGYIATLSAGFKSIIAMLNKGNFLVTDWVPFRGSTAADETDFLTSEAFTFSGNGEGMDVVYIENNFFVDHAGNILPGQANWTRILVHELSHLVCTTKDVNNGGTRYAWFGIGPHAGYPGSDCVQNADNWAFFAADCGAAMTDGQRTQALKIV